MAEEFSIFGLILRFAILVWMTCGSIALGIFLIADTVNNDAHNNLVWGILHTIARAPAAFLFGPIYLGIGLTFIVQHLLRTVGRSKLMDSTHMRDCD